MGKKDFGQPANNSKDMELKHNQQAAAAIKEALSACIDAEEKTAVLLDALDDEALLVATYINITVMNTINAIEARIYKDEKGWHLEFANDETNLVLHSED